MTAEGTPTRSSHVWSRLYPDGVDETLAIRDESTAHAWNTRVDRHPNQTAIVYQGRSYTTTEVDREAEALAAGFLAQGVERSTIVGIYLQNVPQFAVALLAAWKIGAVPLLLNPMYRGRELRALIDDSDAAALICDECDLAQVVRTIDGSSVRWLLTTNDGEYGSESVRASSGAASETPAEVAAPSESAPVGSSIAVERWACVLFKHRTDAPVRRTELLPGLDDSALLTYTSGTTGPSKGAIGTHRNVLAVAEGYGQWMSLGEGDVMLAIAPLFHITGAVACAATSLIFPITLDFIGRVNADKIVSAIRDDKVTVTIGSITVYNALLEHPDAASEDLGSIRYLYSGGAPVPPATVVHYLES